MKYYQIHFDYEPKASDRLFYYGEDIRELYSTKRLAEQEAVRLIKEKRKEPYAYTSIRYEILELEVVK